MTPDKPKKPWSAILAGLLVLSLIFGLWAFSALQAANKKANNSTSQAAAAQKSQQDALKKYNDLLKQPYKTFKGPDNYGTVTFSYPKNWSAYVDSTGANEPINAYFYPDQVPSVQSGTAFPLRVELLNSDYASVVAQYTPQVTQGSISSHAYMPPAMAKNPSVQPGIRLDGAIDQSSTGTTLQGSMVILKVRDKTLQIYTQVNSNLSDFNNVVLNSLTFVP